MASQNIYEYKKIKVIDPEEWKQAIYEDTNKRERMLLNKINEIVIQHNEFMKHFELYKKAFKSHVGENQSYHE